MFSTLVPFGYAWCAHLQSDTKSFPGCAALTPLYPTPPPPPPRRWDQLAEDPHGFNRFVRLLIHFRRATPALQRTTFVNDKDIQWHGEVRGMGLGLGGGSGAGPGWSLLGGGRGGGSGG